MFIRFFAMLFLVALISCSNSLPPDAAAKAKRLWDDDGPIEEDDGYRRTPKSSYSQPTPQQAPKVSRESNSDPETSTQREKLIKWEQRLKEKEQELIQRERELEKREKELGK